MATTLDWRAATAAEDFDKLSRSGFAHEFLRLNDDYQKDYRAMARKIAAGAASEDNATAALARRWGLTFRLRSEAVVGRGACILAARTYPGFRYPHRRASGLYRGANIRRDRAAAGRRGPAGRGRTASPHS